MQTNRIKRKMDQAVKQIGVITVRGPDYHPTRRLSIAAQERGCRILPIHPYTVWPFIEDGRPVLLGDPIARCLDAVMPRQGAEIRDACLPLIGHLERMGVPVINSQKAVELARHKFFTLQTVAAAGLPVVPTIFAPAMEGLRQALAGFGDAGAVVKPVSGRQGGGVSRLRPGDAPSPQVVSELDQGRGILVQQYIDPAGRRDLRVLIIGGHAAAAMSLSPAEGDFRANFYLGGRAQAVDPGPDIVAMAERAAGCLGLQIAGVDLMIDAAGRAYVNEVNYAPGFRALEAATGRDIAGAMIDYVLRVIEDH
jgi:ribosomal protein S6--L-glutamate ligase